jgi:dipeptidyl aminopeptidase/acylaminoacyl peptidase
MAAFNAAKALGVPSEMLLFPGENHWILKPQNSIQWNRVYFAWLDKWLKN